MHLSRVLVMASVLAACGHAAPLPDAPPLTTAQPDAQDHVIGPHINAPVREARTEPYIDCAMLETLALTRNFGNGQPRSARATPDGTAVLFLRSGPRDRVQSLYETSLTTGETTLLRSPDMLMKGPETLSVAERARRERMRVAAGGLVSFELSEDAERILLPLSGRLFVLD